MNTPLSYIELSRKRLIGNIKAIRSVLKKGTKISAVIKANAYGHGQNEVAAIIEPHVDYFQVDDIQEFLSLRKITKKPIFVFGYVPKNALGVAVRLGGILTVYDPPQLAEIDRVAAKLGTYAHVHIKIDAFLGRQGVLPKDINRFISAVKKTKRIRFEGIYAHFANLEDTKNQSHARLQIETFMNAVRIFEQKFGQLSTHISSTAGIILLEKELQNPIVRLGIGLYGLWPSEHIRKEFSATISLKPALRWVTHVAQVKTVPAGYPIGYGLTFRTKADTKLAIIPQGYSDGYDRKLSNTGEVLIRGTRCQILGRIAMNMFVADVSHIRNPKPEDEVILLGSQGKETIPAEELAEKTDTINYEIVARINPLLPRIVVY